MAYIISKIEITPAHLSVDGKRHKHKYYLYPLPTRLKSLGFKNWFYWSYKDGKRGALRFTDKRTAQAIAKKNDAIIEEV